MQGPSHVRIWMRMVLLLLFKSSTQQLLGLWLCWALMWTQSLYKVPSAGETVWINMMSKPFFAVRDQIQQFSSRLTLASYSLLDGNGYFGLFQVAAD